MVFPQCQNPKFTSSISKGFSGKGKKRPKPRSEYGLQFLEKQKAKFTYGITERQFGNCIKIAQKSKNSNPANMLSQLLERRLDNVVYRIGLATSRAFARQVVSHGHILINSRKNNVPSFQVSVGDKISVRKASLENSVFNKLQDKLKGFKFPKWIKFDMEKMVAEVISLPELSDGDQTLNLSTVVEFYSRT